MGLGHEGGHGALQTLGRGLVSDSGSTVLMFRGLEQGRGGEHQREAFGGRCVKVEEQGALEADKGIGASCFSELV